MPAQAVEASQSGVDALFLLWLAPKVIVVGDDRQISPDNVGVDRYVVERLQRQHLPDVELRDLLGLDNSLYDQTATRYRGRIWLQEHFRCMPETIEFSNRLSYGDHLLVPLRQFGTDRLPPLRTVHVDAASRAQDQLWLFHSVQLHDLNPECVRWKLLSHCLNPPPSLAAPDNLGEIRPDILQEPFDNLFEQQVHMRSSRPAAFTHAGTCAILDGTWRIAPS